MRLRLAGSGFRQGRQRLRFRELSRESAFRDWPHAPYGAGLRTWSSGKPTRSAQGRRDGRARPARAVLVVLRLPAGLHRPMDDPYRHLLHYENGSSVESVWVDGRPAVKDALLVEAEEMSAGRRAPLSPEAAARIEAQRPAFGGGSGTSRFAATPAESFVQGDRRSVARRPARPRRKEAQDEHGSDV